MARVDPSFCSCCSFCIPTGTRLWSFIRLTNGFSKKLDNHTAAVSLYVAHYNLCRWHESIRSTPAEALGLTDHAWYVVEPLKSAHEKAPARVGRPGLHIDGGSEELGGWNASPSEPNTP
jgi:hypothetical protein